MQYTHKTISKDGGRGVGSWKFKEGIETNICLNSHFQSKLILTTFYVHFIFDDFFLLHKC